MKCKDEAEFHRSLKAHAFYLLHHDYPCASAASMFEFKILTFLEEQDAKGEADMEMFKEMVECISKMSDNCVATNVTNRFKKVLDREIVSVPICPVCEGYEEYQKIRKEYEDVMPIGPDEPSQGT